MLWGTWQTVENLQLLYKLQNTSAFEDNPYFQSVLMTLWCLSGSQRLHIPLITLESRINRGAEGRKNTLSWYRSLIWEHKQAQGTMFRAGLAKEVRRKSLTFVEQKQWLNKTAGEVWHGFTWASTSGVRVRYLFSWLKIILKVHTRFWILSCHWAVY